MAGRETIAQHNARMRRNHDEAAEIFIPLVADPTNRSLAELDPVHFVEHCCRSTLKHRLPDVLKDYCRSIVNTIRNGGNKLIVLPRGSGKTTVLVDTILYCLVTHKVRYPVFVAANQNAANALLRILWKIAETSDEMHQCFPEFTTPVRELQGKVQRAASQHIAGVRTNLKCSANLIKFADLADPSGNVIAGPTVVARGAGSSIRGLIAANGDRPDAVVVDDPQTAATARSRTKMDQLESYLNSDLRGLAGSDKPLALFCTATPIAPNDIVDRLARRPDVVTVRHPLVESWPTATALWDEYVSLLYGDLADNTTNAHDHYLANQSAMDAGAEVLDPLAYPPNLSSAIERAFVLRATMGAEAFDDEYQLKPPTTNEVAALDATEVSKKLSYVPKRVVPADCQVVLATIDVGTATALHVVVTAYGRNLKAAVIDAFRFPEHGRLAPKDATPDAQAVILTKALVGVVSNLVVPGRYRMEGTGKAVPVTAVGIDRGYRTDLVDDVARYFARRRVTVYAMKGVPHSTYRPGLSTIGKANGVDLRETDKKRWLAFDADLAKETVIGAFRGEPLTTGSLCLWGDSPGDVYPVAQQIAGEKLLEKLPSRLGKPETYRWAPSSVGASNHYLDGASMNTALATWLRYRDPAPVEKLVASGASPSPSQPESRDVPRRSEKSRRHRIVVRR